MLNQHAADDAEVIPPLASPGVPDSSAALGVGM